MIDLQTSEDSSLDATRVTLREITACLRAVGAVALGIAALSREIREWRRDLRNRRARCSSGSSNRSESSRPDNA